MFSINNEGGIDFGPIIGIRGEVDLVGAGDVHAIIAFRAAGIMPKGYEESGCNAFMFKLEVGCANRLIWNRIRGAKVGAEAVGAAGVFERGFQERRLEQCSSIAEWLGMTEGIEFETSVRFRVEGARQLMALSKTGAVWELVCDLVESGIVEQAISEDGVEVDPAEEGVIDFDNFQ